MNGGAVYREALSALRRLEAPLEAERAVVAALDAGATGPLGWSYEAAVEAGLAPRSVRRRAAGVFLCFCAGNLADDLADGDCTYLPDPSRTGPTVQFLLLNLAHSLLVDEVPASDLAAATGDLAAAATHQFTELSPGSWTAARALQVATALGGLQYRAYARILWGGTALGARAGSIGARLGLASFVAEDIRSQDVRFWSMTEADRDEVRGQALDACQSLRLEGVRVVDQALAWVAPILEVPS